MFGVVFFIAVSSVSLIGFTAAETDVRLKEILKRLESTETVVDTLRTEVEYLKSQDKLKNNEISYLKTRIRFQERRSSSLEILIKALTPRPLNKISAEDSVLNTRTHDAEDQSGKNVPINRIRRAENETPVAFFARMDNNLQHAGPHQTFVFDYIITNVGNAYNNHFDSFIAPVSGTYVFSTTLVSNNHAGGHAQFIKNGQALTTMVVTWDVDYATTSQTIVLEMAKGDDVSIQNKDTEGSFFGGAHSTFSGFLLQENSSSSVIIGK